MPSQEWLNLLQRLSGHHWSEVLNSARESFVVLKFEVPYAICTLVEFRTFGAL